MPKKMLARKEAKYSSLPFLDEHSTRYLLHSLRRQGRIRESAYGYIVGRNHNYMRRYRANGRR